MGLKSTSFFRFKMGFTKFVEIGRVAYIAYGKNAGKLVAIVNVITQGTVLIDGPCSGVLRQAINLKHLHLTNIVIKIGPGSRSGPVRKAWEKAEVDKQWAETTWAKKIAAREKRKMLTDYDRFKLMKAKQARNNIIRNEFGKLRAAAKKSGTLKPKKTKSK